MTNPAPSGGMPKWLIILLVVLLVFIVGCCGGIGTCVYLVRRAAQKMTPALQHMQEQMLEDAQKQRDAATQQQFNAAAPSNEPNSELPNASPEAPTVHANPMTPVTPATPSAPVPEAPTPAPASPLASSKFPKNFPTDVPILNGLTPTASTSDNTAGSGMVMLNGKVKTDDAVTYYTQALEKQGYTQSTNTSINDTTTLAYTKDNLQVTVLISPVDNTNSAESNVMITYAKK